MSVFSPRLVADTSATPRQRGAAFLVVTGLHVGALAALTSWMPLDDGATQAIPIHVRLIESPPVSPSPPPLPEKKTAPRPLRHSPPAPPQRILAVESPAPTAESASFVVPPSPPAQAPVAAVAAAAPPPPTAVETVSLPAFEPPRFSAAYLDNPKPIYPPASRRLGEEGKVILRVHVLPDGRPESVEIKASSGFPRLDEAARAAVEKWRFIPARRGEEAVAAWVVVPIVFSLDG